MKKIREIKSESGYMGKRYICDKCYGEVNLSDDYCRWCGNKFEGNLIEKVIDLK